MKITQIINEQEDKSSSNLLVDLMSQFKNMKTFMPASADQLKADLYKNGKAYRGIAQDMVKILKQMEQKGMI